MKIVYSGFPAVYARTNVLFFISLRPDTVLHTRMTEKWRSIAVGSDAVTHGLTSEEFSGVVAKLGRDVTVLELGIIAALFSEHCSYKSTKVHLRNLPTTGPRVLQGPGENAGVIDIGDGECVVFKVESHNHPSFIEPYQGAATGVGGILRDIFTMGARPLALMNGLRFGEPSNAKTPYLLRRAVAGIGGYGNCVGVPTVGGELYFDKTYNGNCLVNAFALGVARHDEIYLGHASGVGNPVVYFGSKTGRDGIRGANMASEGFDENSEEKRPTVQVGDPFQEKLLVEATLELLKSGCVVGIQDMGAAGMTCACYEMADRANSGVRIDLNKVPQRETGMNPYEIMLSESQERMVAVVARGREREALAIIERWELDAAVIGEVIEGGDVELCWNGDCVSRIPAQLLTASVPQYRWPEQAPAETAPLASQKGSGGSFSQDEIAAAALRVLGDVNGCSRFRVFEQYDSTVRGNTVSNGTSGRAFTLGDAGVIRIKGSSKGKGLAMTLDCNSRYCGISPRHGTALSLAEGIRNLSCVGAEPIGISDCLNCGSPERPTSMWQIAECIRGLGDAARAFDVPVVSGNVSLYNETRGEPILPTPTLAVVGLVPDVRKCVPSGFSGEDRVLVIGSENGATLSGSLYDLVLARGVTPGTPMLVYDEEVKICGAVRGLVNSGLLNSCHDVSDGGLVPALCEAAFSNRVGVSLTMLDPASGAARSNEAVEKERESIAFAEGGCRFIVSYSAENEAMLLRELQRAGVAVLATGRAGGEMVTVSGVCALSLSKARATWVAGLDALFEIQNLQPSESGVSA